MSATRRARDFEELAESFGFHPLSIEDCRNAHQRPKVEEYSGYYFIVLYEAELLAQRSSGTARAEYFPGSTTLYGTQPPESGQLKYCKDLWHGWTDRAEQGSGLRLIC